jgi:hypothetical protein
MAFSTFELGPLVEPVLIDEGGTIGRTKGKDAAAGTKAAVELVAAEAPLDAARSKTGDEVGDAAVCTTETGVMFRELVGAIGGGGAMSKGEPAIDANDGAGETNGMLCGACGESA